MDVQRYVDLNLKTKIIITCGERVDSGLISCFLIFNSSEGMFHREYPVKEQKFTLHLNRRKAPNILLK